MFIGSYYYVMPDHIPALNMTSVYYLVFLFLAFVLVRLSKGFLKQLAILLLSAFFIWSFSVRALEFVIVMAGLCYVFGFVNSRFRNRVVLLFTIIPFVCVLVYFKYLSTSLWLPLGLSFYTFKIISYLVDVYLEKTEEEKNVFVLFDYVLFFPCITSGPINRFSSFKENLNSKKEFSYSDFSNGFLLVLLGIFEKIVFCDYLAYVTDLGFSGETGGFSLLICVFLYSFQIYLDFDSVSNIAIGSARALGFDVGRNFNSPYMAASIKEFWHRWHISLSTWLRDYIYIPLGGNRKGELRTYINLMATFVVSGVWHGSTWNFLLWGILHGLLQIGEDLFAKYFRIKDLKKELKIILYPAGVAVNFVFVSLLWLVFRCQTVGEVVAVISKMSLSGSFDLALTHNEKLWLITIVAVVVVLDVLRNRLDLVNILTHLYVVKWVVYFALIVIFLVFGVYGGSYEATDFIYQFF